MKTKNLSLRMKRKLKPGWNDHVLFRTFGDWSVILTTSTLSCSATCENVAPVKRGLRLEYTQWLKLLSIKFIEESSSGNGFKWLFKVWCILVKFTELTF